MATLYRARRGGYAARRMRPLRILLVANEDRHRGQGRWFNTEHKLRNGFIRAGHMVLAFSDRDRARERAWLPGKRFGIARMNAELLALARHFVPHIVLFGHADLCGARDFAALRAAVPGVRLAQFNVDPTFRRKTMTDFAARSHALDASFITTCDAAALAPYAPRGGTVHFMPNPVDPSVETARVFDAPAGALAWDGLFLGTGIEKRGEQLAVLAAALPPEYRFHYGGRVRGEAPMVSTAFLDALATGAACPLLPLDDTRPCAPLYASDRVAQVTGQGVLAFCPASAGLSALYGEGVVEWDTRAALAEAMARYGRDDAARRRVAETGWRLAHERTNATAVASVLAATIMGAGAGGHHAWPTDPFM